MSRDIKKTKTERKSQQETTQTHLTGDQGHQDLSKINSELGEISQTIKRLEKKLDRNAKLNIILTLGIIGTLAISGVTLHRILQ